MPGADFFRKVGVFIATGFIDEGECATLVSAMLAQPGHPAEMFRADAPGYIDEQARRARVIEPQSDGPACGADQKIARMKPDLERFFGLSLVDPAPSDLVLYPTGGFFQPHRDRSIGGSENEPARRRITVVVMLNEQTPEPRADQYAGGDLRLFGLIDEGPWREVGFAVEPAVGQLVAFRAETLHDVTPVTAGNRCVLVTWFY
jgi:SM-20-related protein